MAMKNLLHRFARKASKTELAPGDLPAATRLPEPNPAKTASGSTQTAQARSSAHAAPARQPKQPPTLPGRKAPVEMLTLTLGDFLDRIPAALLEEGEHDRSIPLAFDLGYLSERIWRGDTQIPVTEVFQRVPNVFRANVMRDADDLIRFPWKKVLALISEARVAGTATGLTSSGLEMITLKLRARNLLRATVQAATPCLREPAAAATESTAAEAPVAVPSAPPPPEKALSLVAPEAVATVPAVQEPTTVLPPLPAPNLDLERFTAAHRNQLAALAVERDRAVAANEPLRNELARHHEDMTLERQAAREVSETLELLQKDREEIEALKAERDAALARAAEFGSERDAALSRIADAIAGRDAAEARATKLIAEADAAVALAVELTAGRDAGTPSTVELTAQRDAAAARASQLSADADAAVALATELTAERDAALARIAELSAERDASPASAAEQTATATADSPDQAAWESRAIECLEADIKTYRTRIQTLLAERDAQPAAQPGASAATPRIVPGEPVPDTYATLFQPRFRLPRAVAALVLGFLGLGTAICIQSSLRSTGNAAPEPPKAPPLSHFEPRETPALSEAAFTLESPAHEPTITLLPRGETAPAIQ